MSSWSLNTAYTSTWSTDILILNLFRLLAGERRVLYLCIHCHDVTIPEPCFGKAYQSSRILDSHFCQAQLKEVGGEVWMGKENKKNIWACVSKWQRLDFKEVIWDKEGGRPRASEIYMVFLYFCSSSVLLLNVLIQYIYPHPELTHDHSNNQYLILRQNIFHHSSRSDNKMQNLLNKSLILVIENAAKLVQIS